MELAVPAERVTQQRVLYIPKACDDHEGIPSCLTWRATLKHCAFNLYYFHLDTFSNFTVVVLFLLVEKYAVWEENLKLCVILGGKGR